jgi:predicted RNA binding protein YcfA (HicA-like mRNA interferase family)
VILRLSSRLSSGRILRRANFAKGSHRQYKHPVKKGRVTVPGHPGDDVATGTLKSILRQGALTDKE